MLGYLQERDVPPPTSAITPPTVGCASSTISVTHLIDDGVPPTANLNPCKNMQLLAAPIAYLYPVEKCNCWLDVKAKFREVCA